MHTPMAVIFAIRCLRLSRQLNLTACRECVGGEFITLFYGVVDTWPNMTISYCNCGHEPGILFRDGQMIELDKGGLVLGIMPDAKYEIATMPLRDGDCLMFFTDGLTDAANFDGELWGQGKNAGGGPASRWPARACRP